MKSPTRTSPTRTSPTRTSLTRALPIVAALALVIAGCQADGPDAPGALGGVGAAAAAATTVGNLVPGDTVDFVATDFAFAPMSRRHSVRYTLIGSAMVLSAMIAWSRVMLGVHFPSDVTAGWLGGAGWAFLAAALLYKPTRAAADSEVAETLDPATAAHSEHPAAPR